MVCVGGDLVSLTDAYRMEIENRGFYGRETIATAVTNVLLSLY